MFRVPPHCRRNNPHSFIRLCGSHAQGNARFVDFDRRAGVPLAAGSQTRDAAHLSNRDHCPAGYHGRCDWGGVSRDLGWSYQLRVHEHLPSRERRSNHNFRAGALLEAAILHNLHGRVRATVKHVQVILPDHHSSGRAVGPWSWSFDQLLLSFRVGTRHQSGRSSAPSKRHRDNHAGRDLALSQLLERNSWPGRDSLLLD